MLAKSGILNMKSVGVTEEGWEMIGSVLFARFRLEFLRFIVQR